MYNSGRVLGAASAPVVAATVLPNTGTGETMIALAVAVLAGLLVWGRIYAKNNG
jgi:LPXTG-motif cell wall-anchored protein